MQSIRIKIPLEEGDTPETLKRKANDIFKFFVKKEVIGWNWEEICAQEYVILKITY